MDFRYFLKAGLSMVFLVSIVVTVNAQPLPQHGLYYDTAAMVWEEAIPLGNGLLGALVWGDGNPLKISLDRTDLWDLRPVPQFDSPDYNYQTMRQWVKDKRLADLHRLYDDPYRNCGPTKIPAGRIEINFGDQASFQRADLDLAQATASVLFKDDTVVHVFAHAGGPVGLICIDTKQPVTLNLLAPPFAAAVTEDPAADRIVQGQELAGLRYAAPMQSHGENWSGYLQEGWGGFKFAVVVAWQKKQNQWLAAWSVATSNDGPDPLQSARANCLNALDTGYEKSHKSHLNGWDTFWSQSSVRVPNEIIERQWYLETYKFGAATRSNTPPITLQGCWTADNMKLPPWKGDYHHDLNTELSYWPAYSGNHLDGETGYLNWLWKTKGNARAWTKKFFDLPGLNVPMTADLNQNQIGGWHQYTHSCTTAAWLSHHFYLHWRYSMDREFLRERAYPFIKETAVFLEAVTEKTPDGKRTLPLSSSPEINDDRLDAWFSAITNYDLALIRWTFAAAAELADELDLPDDAVRWRKILSEMPDLALDLETKKMLVAQDYPLLHSHRHFSHLMAIHPLGLVRWENGATDRQIIKASLADLKRLGSSQWCGYSFSWLANLAARARDGQTAENALEIFSTAFCLRNSFHCNGDQSGKGYSGFTYRPFTLEGNFAAAAGLQEMLLQSYSGVIRLFPAIPDTWKNVSFKTLRAEGAFLVSAERRDGRVARVEISCEKGGLCRLENPFADCPFNIAGVPENSVKITDNEINIASGPGQKIVLTCAFET